MKQNTTRIAGLAIAAAMWLGASSNAFAIITFDINTLLPGQTVPIVGTTPWARVTIEQAIDNSTVNLTISTGNGSWGITGTEYISDFYLNYENSGWATLGSLIFTQTPTSPVVPISQGLDAYKADGTGGDFDLKFAFPTAPVGNRFTGGQTFSYVISSASGAVFADDFLATSAIDNAGHGGFYTAAHIQAIGNDSSWAAGSTTPVPEPTTMIAGLLLLLPFAASTLRFFRRKQRTVQ